MRTFRERTLLSGSAMPFTVRPANDLNTRAGSREIRVGQCAETAWQIAYTFPDSMLAMAFWPRMPTMKIMEAKRGSWVRPCL